MTTTSSPRYTAEELAEFGSIITAKLTRAQEDLAAARESLVLGNANDTADTDFAPHAMEDGAPSLEREELMRIVAREEKFIQELQFALARIRAGTYGVCRATGQLIPKERLRLVPHTTLSMAGKQGVAVR
ncbi:MAG: TraR/DksA C4-type zinc finger protein [Flavobacteriales bacterium]